MRTHSPLHVNVVELLRDPSSKRELRFEQIVEDLVAGLVRVPAGAPLRFDLGMEWVEGGILVRGPVRGRFSVTCSRCLAETVHDFTFEAAEVYRLPGDVWEEGYVIEDEHIDLSLLVRDTVLTNLPFNPLCRPDCRGLCPQCGADQNADPCDCVREEGDIRWAALRDLLDGASGGDHPAL
jgi:uncharacterized protein